jgi:ribosome-associated heat shock protein Hsp15
MSLPVSAVRLDKWLWAARFFKTRSLAKEAIERGHVRHAGKPCKVSKDVVAGLMLQVRQGHHEIELQVKALSDQRGPAPVARLLYEETADSIARRERLTLERQLAGASISDEKPSKKQRRDLQRFKHSWRD